MEQQTKFLILIGKVFTNLELTDEDFDINVDELPVEWRTALKAIQGADQPSSDVMKNFLLGLLPSKES